MRAAQALTKKKLRLAGELLAERAAPVVGDEGVLFEKPRGKPYHGKMKALVDAVRAGGVNA